MEPAKMFEQNHGRKCKERYRFSGDVFPKLEYSLKQTKRALFLVATGVN